MLQMCCIHFGAANSDSTLNPVDYVSTGLILAAPLSADAQRRQPRVRSQKSAARRGMAHFAGSPTISKFIIGLGFRYTQARCFRKDYPALVKN